MRLRHSGENEVVVVARGGVEVNVADLEEPLEHALGDVHVLDALEACLLDRAGDDAFLDVEAAVGDRVVRRHPLDEADQDGGTNADDGEDDDQAVIPVVGDLGDDRDQEAEDRSRNKALDIEVDDRAPRGVSLEEDSLSRSELGCHRPETTSPKT